MFPAVGERLGTLPEALPKFAVPSAGSPSSIVGIAALLLLLLSGLGLVLYVVRFVRRHREDRSKRRVPALIPRTQYETSNGCRSATPARHRLALLPDA